MGVTPETTDASIKTVRLLLANGADAELLVVSRCGSRNAQPEDWSAIDFAREGDTKHPERTPVAPVLLAWSRRANDDMNMDVGIDTD